MKALLLELRNDFLKKINSIKSIVPRNVEILDVEGKACVLIGMRRVGKTFTLYNKILELLHNNVDHETILFLNFEDDRLLPADHIKLASLIDEFYALFPENDTKKCYLFFDEIQNISGWPNVIRRLLDTKNVYIYLTGSSAKLLSKEIATSLRGRSYTLEIWPFSFQEFLKAKNIPLKAPPYGITELNKLKNRLEEYLQTGGFPEILLIDKLDPIGILQNYVEAVIFRDIVERYNITNHTLIKYLIKTILNNIAANFSVNKFYNDLKSQGIPVAKNTLYEYLEYIEDSFLGFSINLYSDSLRKTNSNPRKMYAIDTGLVSAFNFTSKKNIGHAFENLVYLDLRRQQYKIYYYLTRKRNEVDFIAIKAGRSPILLQASWNIEDSGTELREKRALDEAKSETGFAGTLITPNSYLEEFIWQ